MIFYLSKLFVESPVRRMNSREAVHAATETAFAGGKAESIEVLNGPSGILSVRASTVYQNGIRTFFRQTGSALIRFVHESSRFAVLRSFVACGQGYVCKTKPENDLCV
jgi:hypothetical protein